MRRNVAILIKFLENISFGSNCFKNNLEKKNIEFEIEMREFIIFLTYRTRATTKGAKSTK